MVPPSSHGIPRVPRYSGYLLLGFVFDYVALTLCGRPSQAVLLTIPSRDASPNPRDLRPLVWPPPRSLATTCGISVDVFSSPYLDVSVQAVPHVRLFDSPYVTLRWVSPFGNLRIEAHLQLPEAYRSLSRPSSAPDAKAFPLRSFTLDLAKPNLRCRSNLVPVQTFRVGPISIGSLTFELCRLHIGSVYLSNKIVNYPNLLVDLTTLSSFTVAFSSYNFSVIQLT